MIGSHVAPLDVPDDPQAVLDRLTDQQTRIVLLTITEGGYGIDGATGAFAPGTTRPGPIWPGRVRRAARSG